MTYVPVLLRGYESHFKDQKARPSNQSQRRYSYLALWVFFTKKDNFKGPFFSIDFYVTQPLISSMYLTLMTSTHGQGRRSGRG